METETTTPTSPAGGVIHAESGEEALPDLPEEEPELVKMEAPSSEAEQEEPAEMKPWERRKEEGG